MGAPWSAAYGAAKAIGVNFGEALWLELGVNGTVVLTICLEATDTKAAAKPGINLSTLRVIMQPAKVASLALKARTAGRRWLAATIMVSRTSN